MLPTTRPVADVSPSVRAFASLRGDTCGGGAAGGDTGGTTEIVIKFLSEMDRHSITCTRRNQAGLGDLFDVNKGS
jgi:hypothetical protein